MSEKEANYGKNYSEESFWKKVKKYAKKIGEETLEKALILYYVGIDKNTPTWAKTVIAGALGYLILPLDAIPDITPAVGFTDDLGVIVAALASIAACIREEHNKQAKDKLKDWFGAKFEGTVKTINAPKAEIIDVTADECNKTCHECNDVIEVSAKFCEHCGAKQNVY